ncbi:MAG: RnfABCDGE type electron transport complex subunit B [Oscillospiraceae bacterium]|nr:RnfABCDGE type electron transport complex subunit B [Oscillospiraceae bacterium]
MTNVIYAILVLGIMGGFFGLVLAIASKIFYVPQDERLEPLCNCLPGANCGGCGFTGCTAYAQAIIDGKADLTKCAAGGPAAAAAMASIMGVEAGEMVREVAFIRCSGTSAKMKANYDGIHDCLAATKAAGNGPLACSFGCLGFGNCVSACQFGALTIVDGIAKVDRELCTGCMACASACPRSIIDKIPYASTVMVECASKDKGPVTMKACQSGCIGCMLCVKACQHEAISVTNFLATVDYAKCTGCGDCVAKCPKHVILDIAPKKVEA